MRDNCIDVRPCTPVEILFGNGPPRFPNRLASNLLFRNRVSHPRFNKTPAQSRGFSRNGSSFRVFFFLSFFFSFNCTQNFLLFRTFESFRPIHNTMEKWKIARVRCLWVKFYSWGRMENWAREYVENEWNLSKGANFCQIFHFWPLTRKLIWNWE